MIGSKRHESSTIRETVSASGEPSKSKNFSISSCARSAEEARDGNAIDSGVSIVPFRRDANEASVVRGAVRSNDSRGTFNAREILLSVLAWGLLVVPRSI
jgi:hypothetical protein